MSSPEHSEPPSESSNPESKPLQDDRVNTMLPTSRNQRSPSSPVSNTPDVPGHNGRLYDPLLPSIQDDPRDGKTIKTKGAGRNTESFDPKSTLIRPHMRVIVGPNTEQYNGVLKHDDVVIVPEFFCKHDDWSIYYKLVEEMRHVQSTGEKKSEWISWHEGAHLITQNPNGSSTYHTIQQRISQYFNISMNSVGTRFNWYRDSSDWKPFHHDSAAYNPMRAKNQNITVGVSFGATRELAFLNAKDGTRIYFPQTNGMMFSFGRDVNILWKHGVNALPENEKDGKGRVSIILWGLCPDVVEEDGSPPMVNNGDNFGGRRGDKGRGGGRPRERSRERGRERGPPHRDMGEPRHYRERSRDRSRGRSRERGRDSRSNGWGDASREQGYRDSGRGRESDYRGSRRDGMSGDQVVCRDFARGDCRYGDRCRFKH
mmetsp:Transcript_3779/g.5866  ORF Transcript_3779/g.5866 Transcript_3779/m.5866 type:complete len:428 (+) Transcript_3779:83-1366(+)|eukprot:CAMPEP_0185030704 /NCGR_PEP_ID=MMETSP1103-20130426/17716_1 /TAXON_ID=36769 /ORGANISM="Paraphysomonas bandaiensis, Strain Caron Lab Isolate" /LENGTH=427 /DNA_ID=CAMNT_0027565925 /DNA_START=45 /DNA_END=1328 /DNA_ORIENTATION=+